MTNKDRRLIVSQIKTTPRNKILITHGTYTMVETAEHLGKLYLKKTIVLTGAFIPGTDKNTNALLNLEYAMNALENLKNGVYIVMNGEIFNWNNVRKNLSENRFEPLTH
ncbi:asparaginase domain-containing protein [Flavobacteriaceae bacterium 3-367]